MNPTVILIAVLLTGALFAVGFAFLDRGDDVKRRLSDLGRTPIEAERKTASNDKLVGSLVDAKESVNLGNRFAEAGWYDMTVAGFTMRRIIFGVILATVFGVLAAVLHQTLIIMSLAALFGLVFGYIIPTFNLDSAIKKRKTKIAQRLPDLLDMVSTTVEAGTALNGALAIAVTRMEGPLADEFRMTLSDIRVGVNRADALTALARRVNQIDLSSMVTALVQTERLGGNVAQVLDELAEEARSRRLNRAEELAAKIPVKMVIPMALFMLPALLVMIFGPVAAQLLTK
jgi:tight adherence protein C